MVSNVPNKLEPPSSPRVIAQRFLTVTLGELGIKMPDGSQYTKDTRLKDALFRLYDTPFRIDEKRRIEEVVAQVEKIAQGADRLPNPQEFQDYLLTLGIAGVQFRRHLDHIHAEACEQADTLITTARTIAADNVTLERLATKLMDEGESAELPKQPQPQVITGADMQAARQFHQGYLNSPHDLIRGVYEETFNIFSQLATSLNVPVIQLATSPSSGRTL